ncbi:MAG TPA: hypothetical protein DDY34_04675 [Bacteroidales bacterium]|nr:hypothetical protein [Bacteroidales bacterium]
MSHNILMPIMNFMTRYYHRSLHNSRFFSLLPVPLKAFYLFLLFAGVFMLGSCEEKPTMIGKDILPGNDFISITTNDAAKILSYTMYDSPVRSEDPTTPFIGTMYDPYFGTTVSEFVSQIRLERQWVTRAYDVDSVKLVLRINSVSGSSDLPKQIRITEISTRLYEDSAYYTNTAVDTTDFGISVDIPPLRNDTINRIEVNLPPFFGEYLIRDQEKLFYSTTIDDFRSYFKGIYMRVLSASETDPLLLGLNITLATSLGDYTDYIILYMHDREDVTVKYTYRFILDPLKENASFSRIEHDFTTAGPDKGIEDILNKPVLDTLSYLQGLNGVYTKLIFPGLDSIKNDPSRGRIAVNKASLFIPVHYDGDAYTPSTVPEGLLLRYVNSSGVKDLLPDYYIDQSHAYFGGSLDTAFNRYKFNISNFIQQYLDDTKGVLKPEIEVFQRSSDTRNVILKANDSKTPVKFELIYTLF